MFRPALVVGCVLAGTAASHAQEPLPAQVLNDLKAATVLVKVQTGRQPATGSGFLMLAEGDIGLIVTNEHVVAPAAQRPAPSRPAKLDVVFNSGRKNERVVRAEVAAADPDRDLAILRVRDIKDLPKPLDLNAKAELVETLPVYIVGFPFGQALSAGRGHPAVTVGKGTISSVREDDRGDQKIIQLDGDVNPGNSGGPVVDAKGRLVGVTVAKVRGTNIGLAIPPVELTKMLNGRVSGVALSPVNAADNVAEIRVSVRLIDPLNKVKAVAARVVTTDKPVTPLKPGADGRWPPLPDAQVVDLKIEGQSAVGTFKVSAKGMARVTCVVQPVITNGANEVVYLQPTPPHTEPVGDAARLVGKPLAKPDSLKPPTRPDTPPAPAKAAAVPVVEGLTIKELSIGPGRAPNCLCWSPDAKAFYQLDGHGVVRRVNFATFTTEVTYEADQKCTWLSLSAEGLVATVPEEQEVHLLDPVTLKVIRKAPWAGSRRVVSSPGSHHAYAAASDLLRGWQLSAIDLKAGKVVKQYALNDLGGGPNVGFDHLALTADGRWLFSADLGCICRFTADGATARFEEKSPALISGQFAGLCLSADGRLICAPSGGGNNNVDGEERGPNMTYVYRTGSLTKSTLALNPGPFAKIVGFDVAAGLIYTQNLDCLLIVFNGKGNKIAEYKECHHPGRRGLPSNTQFLVHPAGRKLLVLTEDGPPFNATSKLFYVELADK